MRCTDCGQAIKQTLDMQNRFPTEEKIHDRKIRVLGLTIEQIEKLKVFYEKNTGKRAEYL